ncbi:nucleotidyltransferase domain-containing protein [Massilia horti]|uniref:Nucleotidyltransferase domain-containing protein n=1 Tax=Massilia horti TaxID=2562153 RepID=A0A4Y9SLX5_9BURK|nr:nucleotidyltransferase domain-containing protein [Massilia horti]TFW27660.1 nucleotidyltransferase domain-containing protein [Massilia horti]
MIALHIREEIQRRLVQAEQNHDVKVIWAIESGSRAWGFESPNSDYDARFIYVNRPAWYLSVGLEEQRDVIEYPIVDDLDVNGWDLRKALRLFWKSNPAFMEWIQSPIVYMQRGTFAERCRMLAADVYSIESGIYHYRSMAKTNFRGYLRDPMVPLKKYFYVLRPLLAVRWLERHKAPAPIEFEKLLEVLDDPALLAAIDALLEQKRSSPELGLSPQIPAIQQFIVNELERIDGIVPPRLVRKDVEPKLSDLFRQVLTETWGVQILNL